ncbi:TATA-binding protein-associated factor 172-like isoform X2 [Pomacea canaliculata]|uniref:TATA-binding protein-associated factor 172-like isoform X2 n=1 Tax=Pomacea canaliculata TaxID=400727 RepID=UPI000D727D51|nr:TATA-binding protein-associated factor 172-like isoform X2 [Pomacea canaliculata]
MTTRLDRLFLLLDTGSTPLIRKSAAEQLGEVQRLHPYELNNLLVKVHGYLRSNSWDTRIAAGQALEAIARNVPQWDPVGAPKSDPDVLPAAHVAGRILFSQFNIQRVLSFGSSLLSCEGAQYDCDISATDKEHLHQQRMLLNKRLGLDIAGSLGMDTTALFNDEDLCMETGYQQSPVLGPSLSQPISELVRQQLVAVTSGLTGERKTTPRLARTTARLKSTENNKRESIVEIPAKRVKLEHDEGESKLVVDIGDNTVNPDEIEEWPFAWLCEALMNDLFHSAWEIRHGAATGLREILKSHARGAGKSSSTPADQMTSVNQTWLVDASLRLLCVLALDRFGDFVADEVVAPVRETCAQTLGVIARHLTEEGVEGMVGVVLQLLGQQQWEVRHGGLLSLKYVLAARQDLTRQLLPMVLQAIFYGLQDPDDDVRAVAAASLIPVSQQLACIMPDMVPVVVASLWETLLDLDDLTASTNSIMMLLARLLSQPASQSLICLTQSLTGLVPRLWPFLRHNISTVRRATLQTMLTLLTQNPSQGKSEWIAPILQDTLRHVYQRSLLEPQPELLQLVEQVWDALLQAVIPEYLVATATPWLGVWLCLLMQPAKMPYEPTYLLEAKHRVKETVLVKQRPVPEAQRQAGSSADQKDYIGGGDDGSSELSDKGDSITRARIVGARLLGKLASCITQPLTGLPPTMEPPAVSLGKLCIFHLNTKSALQRLAIAQMLIHWAQQLSPCHCPAELKARVLECLNENIYYDEIALAFTRMQTDVRDFLACLKQEGINLESMYPPNLIIGLEQAMHLVTSLYDQVKVSLKPRVQPSFQERRRQLHAIVSSTYNDHQALSVRVLCSLAMAVVKLDELPDKLNPVIRPIMEAIRCEENEEVRSQAALCLAHLMQNCLSRNPSPNGKIIKNLCGFLCADPTVTPNVMTPMQHRPLEFSPLEVVCDSRNGILTLTNLQKMPEQRGRGGYRRSNSIKADGEKKNGNSVPDGVAVIADITQTQEDQEQVQKQLTIQRLGSEVALTTICEHFGATVPEQVPELWNICMQSLENSNSHTPDDTAEPITEAHQEIVNSLQLLEVVIPTLNPKLLGQVMDHLTVLCNYLHHISTAIRHMAARVIAVLSVQQPSQVLTYVIENVLPALGATQNNRMRQGACEALSNILEQLGLRVVPYIVLMMVPVLGRMADQDSSTRLMATHCFATLIRLMPLEAGIPDPPELKPSLAERRERERHFLEQLLDSSKLEPYHITVPVKATLRKYQQDGVNWLGFLNKYKLHGILCDDMGLGKTLQSLCLLASDHYNRQQAYQSTKNPDCAPLPSIVICPPTLVGHWVYEVKKFIDTDYLNPLMYAGPPAERVKLQRKVKSHNLIIASYDVVRNDIDFFSSLRWNYCILDEGHIIRNGKTKLSKAAKQLISQHRLILSGTPIQNNVLDLWSLFDFLMPGFLGTERQFQARFGKPILLSRDAKSTSKEQEAGALAMEKLHRQVLPFILRRLKEDVLNDLPPKIIQDYYCDLSPLQVELYEDFAKSRAKRSVDDVVTSISDEQKEKKATSQGTTHIFQALLYLRKVCNHPALVLTSLHPKYPQVMERLTQQHSTLHDLQHAPKLSSLRQLLLDCGIGAANNTGGGPGPGSSSSSGTDNSCDADVPVVGQHRVLLFCQLKGMLDIVEKDLLKIHMPTVTYLRLDGSVPAGSRYDIVHRFNNDPSIDMLLLTTHVGGLGLNLTGADTVIFVEHDWNPMKDLQAMDRAHRIGQKKVVNVYRLITRGTLEDKIMGLQKFKMTVATTVIGQDNASLQTMSTEQLLDLFTLDCQSKGTTMGMQLPTSQSSPQTGRESMRAILDSLEELWDEKQYESEYNLDSFMKSLTK